MLVLRQMVHYLDFPPHIIIVLLAKQLPFGNRLASVDMASGLVGAEIGGAKLTLTQFLAKSVDVCEELGLVRKNPSGFLIWLWCCR